MFIACFILIYMRIDTTFVNLSYKQAFGESQLFWKEIGAKWIKLEKSTELTRDTPYHSRQIRRT